MQQRVTTTLLIEQGPSSPSNGRRIAEVFMAGSQHSTLPSRHTAGIHASPPTPRAPPESKSGRRDLRRPTPSHPTGRGIKQEISPRHNTLPPGRDGAHWTRTQARQSGRRRAGNQISQRPETEKKMEAGQATAPLALARGRGPATARREGGRGSFGG
jgi:hypothetical protein